MFEGKENTAPGESVEGGVSATKLFYGLASQEISKVFVID